MTETRLDQAANLIRSDGWTQDVLRGSNGSRCMSGAIADAWKADNAFELRFADYVHDVNTVLDVIREQYGIIDVAYVNDNIMTSPDQAIAVLEKAYLKRCEEID